MARQCKGTTAAGMACKRPPSRDSDYCLAHDSDRADAHAARAAMGGKARWSSRVTALQGEIRDLMRRVDDGEVGTQKANILLQGFRLLRELEADKRYAGELDDLEAEMRRLKETVAS